MFLCGLLALANSSLAITNLSSGDTIRSAVVIVRGTADTPSVRVGRQGGAMIEVRTTEGKFSVPVELRSGTNTLVVRGGKATAKTTIQYHPARDEFRVVVVYLQAADEPIPTMMEVPTSKKSDVESRVSTSVKLMQAFCEDHFRTVEGTSKTFTVDYRSDGQVKIHFLRLPESGDSLRAKSGGDLWGQFNDQLGKIYDFSRTKVLGIMGFTRFDPATQKTGGHTALGGGSFGLFGSGAIRYWPASVADSARAFFDNTVVTSTKSFDDSGGRQRAWANAATAIGAMMHEMGHAFGLPHSPDRRCVMSRGFDQFNAALFGNEISTRDGKLVARTGSYWDPVHTARLSLSPYFQPDRKLSDRPINPTIRRAGDTIRLEAADELALICVWQDGKPNWSQKLSGKIARFSLKDLRSKIGGDEIQIVAISKSGGDVTVGFKD